MRVRVARSIAAIVPWKVALVGLGGLAGGDPGGPDEVGGEPDVGVTTVPKGLGATAGPDEQAPTRQDADRQTATVRLQWRHLLTTTIVGRSGNAAASPG
jgi:hypothetical protein